MDLAAILDSITDPLDEGWSGGPAGERGLRWQAVSSERMERMQRLAQVIVENLREAEVLSPELEREAARVHEAAGSLRGVTAQIDARLAVLRDALLEREGADAQFKRLQSSLPALLEDTLAVCQLHGIGDVEQWLRRDGVVGEVCSAVGCSLIDPAEGEAFDPLTMRTEQSELTYDGKLDGRVCRCLTPGVAVRTTQDGQAVVLRPAQVCTYSAE